MQRYYGEKRDVHGRVEPYATVSVYESGTDTLATIYDAFDTDDTPSTAIPNPLTADANGKYAFAATNGDYDIVCRGSGAQDYKVRVNLFDSTTSSSGGAGGNNGEVQWNSGGVLTGSPGLTTDGNTLTAKSVQFNTTSPVTTNTKGNTYWDTTYGTLSTVLDSVNGVVLQHGQEVHIQCVNKTLATILNGQAVYIDDAQGNRPTCALARADSISTCEVIGIATQDIDKNQTGLITVIGRVNDINTSGYTADGRTLYLSAATAGALTETAPSSPNYVVRVGVNLNTTISGALFVSPNRPLAADTTMAANTNAVPPTQAAAKAYANSAAASALSIAEAYTDTLRSDLASTSDVTKGDALIGVKSELTGAVARTQHDKNAETVSVMDFGAVGDGLTDDTPALSLAKNAIPANGTILFPAGKTYKIGTVDFTGKACVVAAYGATILCTSSTGAFYKTDHGNNLEIYGANFVSTTSGARAINHQTTGTANQYSDLFVFKCSFKMKGAFGIYCVGTRSAKIQSCEFFDGNGGDGVYFKDANAPYIENSHFYGSGYTNRAIHYPGTGNGTDCGLVVRDCEVMGWNQGIEVVGCDMFFLFGSTVDYNIYSIKLDTQDGAVLQGNYIGTHTNNPALWITASGVGSGWTPSYSQHILVDNNVFTGHDTVDNLYDCILVDGSPDFITVKNCVITFYTRYGIKFTTTARIAVEGCSFSQSPSKGGTAPIYNSTGAGDSAVTIRNNVFGNSTTVSAMNLAFALCNYNLGCATEAKGQTFIGAGISTYTVAHGCNFTPTPSEVKLVSANVAATILNPYINSIDATNLVIGFTSATTTTTSVCWSIKRGA